MTQIVRFATVGARGYARTLLAYMRMLVDKGRGQLVAATIRNKASRPNIVARFEADGVQVFDSYEAMLAACQGKVDVVVLPTAIHHHAPMSIAALEGGYHVLVEKPAAARLTDVDRMIAAREASGKQCAVGFQLIYSPVIQALKRTIGEGKLGRVKRIRTIALWPRGPVYYERNNWAGKLFCDGQPVYDSPFNNALAHHIMNMLYLAFPGRGRAAYAAQVEAELFRTYDIESFDTGCLRVRTDSDVEVVFAASHACDTLIDPVMQLEAERAAVYCQLDERATITYTDGTTETIEQEDPREQMFHNVIEAVTGTASEPLCTLEIARAHVACIEAMHQVAPIVTIPPSFVSQTTEGQRVIVGVAEAVQQVFADGQLFSEIGAPFV